MQKVMKEPRLQPDGGKRPARQVSREPVRESPGGGSPAPVAAEAAANLAEPPHETSGPPQRGRHLSPQAIAAPANRPGPQHAVPFLVAHRHLLVRYQGKSDTKPRPVLSA